MQSPCRVHNNLALHLQATSSINSQFARFNLASYFLPTPFNLLLTPLFGDQIPLLASWKTVRSLTSSCQHLCSFRLLFLTNSKATLFNGGTWEAKQDVAMVPTTAPYVSPPSLLLQSGVISNLRSQYYPTGDYLL